MRRIPVDQTRIRLIASGKHAARAVYAELSDGSRRRVPDAQDKDDRGRPMWTIDVIVDDPDADRAEIAAVKLPSYDEPVTTFGEVITFVALTALPYVQQGSNRVSLSFSAEGIERPVARSDKAA